MPLHVHYKKVYNTNHNNKFINDGDEEVDKNNRK